MLIFSLKHGELPLEPSCFSLAMNSTVQRELDKLFVDSSGLPSIVLMEQAAAAVSDELCRRIDRQQQIIVLCGFGQNAGDGWAIARQLNARGYCCSVVDLARDRELAGDAGINRRAYKRLQLPEQSVAEYIDLLQRGGQSLVVVEAVFGTGFQVDRVVPDEVIEVFAALKQATIKLLVAVDIPAGCSDSGQVANFTVPVDLTISMGAHKLAAIAAPAALYSGEVVACPISINNQLIAALLTHQDRGSYSGLAYLIDNKLAGQLLPEISGDAHKGSTGRGLLLAGSDELYGAQLLALNSCLHTPVGYLHTVAANEEQRKLILTAYPQCLLHGEADLEKVLTQVEAVALGCGSANDTRLSWKLRRLLATDKRIILDADALNCLAQDHDSVEILKNAASVRLVSAIQRNPSVDRFCSEIILTPHPGEFHRLAPELEVSDRQLQAYELARRTHSIVVLKGYRTVVAIPYFDREQRWVGNDVYINLSGNSELARAGAGDVLTGLILGYSACTTADCAALLAVYLHGAVADQVLIERGRGSLLINEIAELIAPQIEKVRTDC